MELLVVVIPNIPIVVISYSYSDHFRYQYTFFWTCKTRYVKFNENQLIGTRFKIEIKLKDLERFKRLLNDYSAPQKLK